MPKKKPLKSLEEAKALLNSRKRKPRKKAPAAPPAKPLDPLEIQHPQETLDALGLTALFNEHAFIVDGMTSSPFTPRPEEPTIPYVFPRIAPNNPLAALFQSWAYDWWKKRNAEEIRSIEDGNPEYQVLCREWACLYHDGPYIYEDWFYKPHANNVALCDVFEFWELWDRAHEACVIGLQTFLGDLNCTSAGAISCKHLLTEEQKAKNAEVRIENPTVDWFDEYKEGGLRLERVDPSQPWSKENTQVFYEHPKKHKYPIWLRKSGKKSDRAIEVNRLQTYIKEFVLRNGPQAALLIERLHTRGKKIAVDTLGPFIGNDDASQRPGFLGSVDEAAKAFEVDPEIFQRFCKDLGNCRYLLNSEEEDRICRKYRDWLKTRPPEEEPDWEKFLCFRCTWTFDLSDEVVPPGLLKKALAHHRLLHRPWELAETKAHAWIGPELYAWLKSIRSHKERSEAWEGVLAAHAAFACAWWFRDWLDGYRKLKPMDETYNFMHVRVHLDGKDVHRRLPKNRDFGWTLDRRTEILYELLTEWKHISVPSPQTGEPYSQYRIDDRRKTPSIWNHWNLPAEPLQSLWSDSIKAFGAYALAGGIQNDWWLRHWADLALSNQRCRWGNERRPAPLFFQTHSNWKDMAFEVQDALPLRKANAAFHSIGPDGQTRPAAIEQHHAWIYASREVTRWAAGEPGARVFLDPKNNNRWKAFLETLREIVEPWMDKHGEFPKAPMYLTSASLWDLYQMNQPFSSAAHDVINRNRADNQQFIDHHRKEWKEQRAKEEAANDARIAREKAKEEKRRPIEQAISARMMELQKIYPEAADYWWGSLMTAVNSKQSLKKYNQLWDDERKRRDLPDREAEGQKDTAA